MSNFAGLIAPLVIAGSRKSDGSANASGYVWAFTPGTNAQTAIYADAGAQTVVSQPLTLDQGGRIDYSLYPNGIYAKGPIRLLIQDSTGATVTDTVFIPATAGNTGVSNPYWTGSTVDAVLSALGSSVGGLDGMYLESGTASAATPGRSIQYAFRELRISVKDSPYSAIGDGIAIDTTAIQSAINRVIALGGGQLYFPPGTYKVDQALVANAPSGVRFAGAGIGATTLSLTNATSNCLTLATPMSCAVENMTITHASSTTGYAISASGGSGLLIRNVAVTGTGYARGLNTSGSPSNLRVENSSLFAAAAGYSAYLSTVSGCTFISTTLSCASGTCMAIDSTTANVTVVGCNFAAGTNGFLFNSGASGTGFTLIGNFNIGSLTAPINTTLISTDPKIRQFGNGVEYTNTTSAVGAAQTPSLMSGRHVRLMATSGGAGTVTVNAPAILPGSTTDQTWNFTFVNGSGGAVTWSLNAVFKTSASIPTTDGHTIEVLFGWDATNSKLREISRADTTT